MTNKTKEIAQLKAGIAALEAQRPILGDAVVEASLKALRQQISALEATLDQEPAKKKGSQIKGAQRRQLTVLFCDLVGSTALSEKLDVEDFRQVILDYQQVAEKVIKRFGGHIGQYLGDGLLVYFGYPKGLEEAPKAGVRAGLGILEAVEYANKEWAVQGKSQIEIRIGIHTGLVVVDDFLALGDTVNIAARLEGLAPTNGLVISQQTMKLVKGWFEVQSLGTEMLKGIKEPMPIYQVLHESGARSRLEAVSSFGLSPMVGREMEIQLLAQSWQQSKLGQGQIVLLNGEAGIGKSRLVESTKQTVAKEANAWLVELRCAVHYQNSPFYPLTDVLENVALQFEKTDTAEIKRNKLEGFLLQSGLDLGTSLPLMADFLSIPLPTSDVSQKLQGAEQKKRTMETLVQILWNRAAKQPVLLVIEDLHWADPSTLEWVDMLLEQISDKCVFMLCTTRPQFQPQWIQIAPIQQLVLNRLSADNIEVLCHHQTKGKALPREVLAQIKSKTDGVPLFVEELSKMIVESELVIEEGDHYSLSGTLVPLAIPTTLQDSLMARLDRLAPVRETIQTGAVLGREFSLELLQAVTQKNYQDLQLELSQLMEAGLFYQKGSPTRVDYIFKHALIQDTAYDSLLKSRRQQLHQKVAQVLEEQFPEAVQNQPELLAHHQTKAGLLTAAIHNWKKAAQLARKHYAHKEAIRHLNKGLALTRGLTNKEEALKLEFKLYDLLSKYIFTELGFSHPELKKVNEQLITRAHKLGRSNEIFINQIALIIGEFAGGNFDVMNKLEDLLTLAETDGDNFSIAAIQCFMGMVSVNAGEYKIAKMHCENVLELYDPALHGHLKLHNGANVKMENGVNYLLALQFLGYPDQARAHLSLLQQLATTHGNLQDLFLLTLFFPNLHLILKEYPAIIPMAEKGLTVLEGSEDSWVYQLIQMVKNNGLAGMGDQEAVSYAYEAFISVRQFAKFFNGIWISNIAKTYKSLYLPEEGLEIVEDALSGLLATGEGSCLPELFRLKGDFLLMLKKPETEAEQLYLKAIEISKNQSAKWHELLAAKSLARLWQSQACTLEPQRKRRKIKDAYDLLNGVYSWFTEGFDTVDMQEAKALLDELALAKASWN